MVPCLCGITGANLTGAPPPPSVFLRYADLGAISRDSAVHSFINNAVLEMAGWRPAAQPRCVFLVRASKRLGCESGAVGLILFQAGGERNESAFC